MLEDYFFFTPLFNIDRDDLKFIEIFLQLLT